MPNFWSRGLQYLEEKFGAEITKDKDLEKMLIKIEKIEKGFASFRTVIQNFNSYFEKFSTFFSDLSKSLELIYSNTPYYSIIEEFIVKQQIINIHIEEACIPVKNETVNAVITNKEASRLPAVRNNTEPFSEEVKTIFPRKFKVYR